MTTNADITAQLALCAQLNLTEAQILQICDWAVAALLSGKPVAEYQIAGRTMTFANLQTVQGVRDYYQQRINAAAFTVQTAEL
jgi:hypothetical protein